MARDERELRQEESTSRTLDLPLAVPEWCVKTKRAEKNLPNSMKMHEQKKKNISISWPNAVLCVRSVAACW
jgi:hypothetical protein